VEASTWARNQLEQSYQQTFAMTLLGGMVLEEDSSSGNEDDADCRAATCFSYEDRSCQTQYYPILNLNFVCKSESTGLPNF
jgi:hypothetical protein